MNLIDSVLKSATKAITKNVENLKQQGIKKFIQDSGLKTEGMTQEAILTAYNNFKAKNPDKLVNGEYLGKDAKQVNEILSNTEENVKKEAEKITDKGQKIKTKELLKNPKAVLHYTAETIVDKKIDEAVQGKVGEILKKYKLIKGQRPNDEVRDLIRNTIRGTKNSIFRDPTLKANLTKAANTALDDYYKAVIELLENPDWQSEQLKPLNDMIGKQFSKINDAQNKLNSKFGDINSELEKYKNKLNALEKLDIAKQINDQVHGKLDLNSRLSELNDKLGMFGLEQQSVNFIGDSLNKQLADKLNKELAPSIKDNIAKLDKINKRVAEVQKYVQKYEDYVKKEIAAFENKAKDYIKKMETKLLSSVLASVHLKLGKDGLKLHF